MQPLDESKIVEQIQNPEQRKKVFATIVAQYSEPLYWQIRKMVISHDDTDDLLQNTFMKAWCNLEYFRAEARLSTLSKEIFCSWRCLFRKVMHSLIAMR